ncbi:MAG TPA: hypothetical protein VGI39_00525 [Polyangiaceae bacterium]
MNPTIRGRPARFALGAAGAVVAFFVLYATVANVLLTGGRLARMLSEKPETFRLRYDRASSLWFGRVHVEGLDVRVRDPKIELELHIDRADASISLFALLARHLRASPVDATGVSWRMRFRHEDRELSEDKASLLPPIDGFPARPIVDVPPLPASDAPARPVTIDLDEIRLHDVREVWIDSFRLSGALEVQGGFTIAPRDHLEVRPAHVEVREATLATGAEVIVSGTHGAADVRIEATPLEGMGGAEVVRHLSTRSTLEGKIGGLGFLRHFLPEGVEAAGGEGVFRGTLAVDRGIATRESASHLELEHAQVMIDGVHEIGASAAVDLSTIEDDAGRAAVASVALRDVSLFERPARAPAVTSAAMALRARVGESDFATMPRDFTYGWDAPKVEVGDLRILNGALGREAAFRVEAGSGTVTTRGEGSLRGIAAHVKVESNAAVILEGAHVGSRVGVEAPVKVGFEARTVDLSGATVEFGGVGVRGNAADPTWTGRVKLESAVVHATPPSADLTFTATGRDARPLLALYGAMKDVSPATRVVLGVVPDAAVEAVTANLAGGGRVHVAPGVVAVRGLDVKGAGSRVRGEWGKRGEVKSGGFLVEAGPVSVGLAFEGAGVRAVVVGAEAWFAGVSGGRGR